MKKGLLLLVVIMMCFAFSSCSDKNNSVGEVSPTPTTDVILSPNPTDEVEPELRKPEFVNLLTGLEITEVLSAKRPVAVMINNAKIATPQPGIGLADVIYECSMEGGYTRLMCLFSDYSLIDNLGSVRSARDYFLDFAQNHDGIYIHAGGSPQAYTQMKDRKIDHIDGVNGYIANTFYRDGVRRKKMGYEHSLMTNAAGIKLGIEKKKFRTDLKDGFVSPFAFADAPYVPVGQAAKYVKLKYSGYITAEFFYDSETKKYARDQYGKAHIDGTTNGQISFENIFVLFAPHEDVKGDDKGRIIVDFTGTGSGYYLNQGQAVPINWKKSSRDGAMTLLNEDGTQFMMNTGKSFICIASNSVKNKIVIEGIVPAE